MPEVLINDGRTRCPERPATAPNNPAPPPAAPTRCALYLRGVNLTTLALPETLPVERRRNGGVAGTLRDYGRLFGDRAYLGLILVAGLAMAALFAYVSGSSFVNTFKVQRFA